MNAKLPVVGAGDRAGFVAGKGGRPHPAKRHAEGLVPDAHVDEIFLPKLALDALTLDEQTGVIADALKSLLGLGHEANGIVHGGGVLDLRLGRRPLWRGFWGAGLSRGGSAGVCGRGHKRHWHTISSSILFS